MGEEQTKNCPYCGEIININAKKCKHCGEWIKEENVMPDTVACPYCGEQIKRTARKCIHCKTWLEKQKEDYIRCPFCHEAVPANAEKCANCGEWLADESFEGSCGCGFSNPMVNGIVILSVIVLVIGLFISMAEGSSDAFWIALVIALFCGIFLYFYFLPTIIAISRKHPQTVAIFLINLFFGETLIGWVGALIWATIHRQGRHTHW